MITFTWIVVLLLVLIVAELTFTAVDALTDNDVLATITALTVVLLLLAVTRKLI